jgi:cephalosporin hydroxylase
LKITIDTQDQSLVLEDNGRATRHPLYGNESFAILSELWSTVGWNQKYTYGFTWMGRPVIQLPEDMVRIQETIFRVRPDVIVETGVAHGGSLVFYASLFKAMGQGRVIGVDVEIRPHNRRALEEHELSKAISLVEGSSVDRDVVSRVQGMISKGERVLVILDSNHTKAHVSAELTAYSPMVSVGSYIVATDGIMESVAQAPRGRPAWAHDNPAAAAREFAQAHPEFALESPPFVFDETLGSLQVTHWPAAYLRRVSA